MRNTLHYFDARYAQMLEAAGLSESEPDDPRRIDVRNAFIAALEREGLRDAYLQQVFRDLAKAGLIGALPGNRRQRRQSR